MWSTPSAYKTGGEFGVNLEVWAPKEMERFHCTDQETRLRTDDQRFS